jgi:hypothetical protein
MRQLLSPARRRSCIEQVRAQLHISERRACAVLGQHRSTQRKVLRGRDHEDHGRHYRACPANTAATAIAPRLDTSRQQHRRFCPCLRRVAGCATPTGSAAHAGSMTGPPATKGRGCQCAWKEQIKSPNPMTGSPSAMLSKLSLPSISPAGSWPNADAFPMAAMNPLQLWMQLAEQWQKAWTDAMAFWVKAGKPYDGVGLRTH